MGKYAYFFSNTAMGWMNVPGSSVESDDTLTVRLRFLKETAHAFGPSGDVLETFCVPIVDEVITIRPSELCSEDTASVMQSYSVRTILSFVNTHYPPSEKEIVGPKVVAGIIKLVQDSMESFPLPSDRVLVMERWRKVVMSYEFDDQVMKAKLVRFLEDTKRGTCDICLEDYEVGLDATRLPCFHVFHRACNAEWLAINPTCPRCRYNIPSHMVNWF